MSIEMTRDRAGHSSVGGALPTGEALDHVSMFTLLTPKGQGQGW